MFASKRPSDDEMACHYDGYPRTDFDSAITRARYRELLKSFEPHRKTGRILDAGCGIGFFLEEAQDAGWEPYGTEYGERVVEINRAKELNVFDASAGTLPLEPDSFDVVTAFEVLEHVRDPAGEVGAGARLLRAGGLFYCTTPNFDALSRRILGNRWSVIEYPEHLNYFTSRSLGQLFERLGFRTLGVLSSGLDVSQLRAAGSSGGESLPSGAASGEDLRARIEASALLRASKWTINAVLAALRAGDSLKGRFELQG